MNGDHLIGKKFRHYKTKGVYEVRDVVEYTGDDASDYGPDPDLMVYYYSFTAKRCFTRPYTEFTANVNILDQDETLSVPRFEPL